MNESDQDRDNGKDRRPQRGRRADGDQDGRGQRDFRRRTGGPQRGDDRRRLDGEKDYRGTGGGDRGQRSGRDDRDDRGARGGGRYDRYGRSDRYDRGGRGGDRNDRYDRDQRSDRRSSADRGERRSYGRQDGERRDYDRRSGERRRFEDRGDRDRDRGARRDSREGAPQRGRGGTRGGGRSDRAGGGREFTEAERLQHELRPVRSEHRDPEIPREVSAKDLHPAARNELKTLQTDTQESAARHLAMVAALIDDDPELAHQHAISASRRAGRIPVARETLAITAYRTGDYALALRELRTYRRLTGSEAHIALMIDCERGLGRPEKGIETGLEADLSKLGSEERVHVAIAMSGARLDLGQTQQALFELEIRELDPQRAYSWSPELFSAYATVLEDLGRAEEAAEWHGRAEQAEAALQEHYGAHDTFEVFEVVESESEDDSDLSSEADEPPAEDGPRGEDAK